MRAEGFDHLGFGWVGLAECLWERTAKRGPAEEVVDGYDCERREVIDGGRVGGGDVHPASSASSCRHASSLERRSGSSQML